MTAIFEEVRLTWKGVTWTIHPNQTLRVIASIEEIITIAELVRYQERNTAPLSKLAQAYGAVLRIAGCRVTDEEVYASMFGGKDSDASIATAISALLMMMVPRTMPVVAEAAAGNVPPGVDNNLFAKPIKLSSAPGGSRRRNSGN